MSKELFEQIQEQKTTEWVFIMDNEIFTRIPFELRVEFKTANISYPDEHKYLYENDPNYREYYKTRREAGKELDKIRFMHREKSRRHS